jgi:phosphoglycolate phosphatase-like HAD superfamily hydrolase
MENQILEKLKTRGHSNPKSGARNIQLEEKYKVKDKKEMGKIYTFPTHGFANTLEFYLLTLGEVRQELGEELWEEYKPRFTRIVSKAKRGNPVGPELKKILDDLKKDGFKEGVRWLKRRFKSGYISAVAFTIKLRSRSQVDPKELYKF